MELESILLPGIEAKRPIVIAGPCSAETEEQVMDTAKQLAAKGQKIYRAGIWKPRTKPGGFEGIGVEGLAWLKEVKKETGMYVSTEVATAKHVYECLKAGIDILWVGARTTANPFAVQEIADALKGVDIPVLVKNPRLKAIATISMYNMGTASRNGLKHSLTLEQRKQIMAEAAEQRYAEFLGGETKYTGGTVQHLTEKSSPIEREFYEFYRTQRGEFTPDGATPMTTTHPTLSSNVKFMNFYPFEDIETISPRPMLFITGENAHSREFSEDAYRLAAEPKELYIVPGAGHVDLYDRVSLIPFDKLESFFKEYLKK